MHRLEGFDICRNIILYVYITNLCTIGITYLASDDVMNKHDEILGKKPRFLFISNTDSPINESHYIDYHRSVEK